MSSIAEENLSVVVVDDDPIYRELICTTVAKNSNFVIFEASSGDELFDVLAAQRIDCIVLDYDLGLETGFAVMRRVDESNVEPPPTVMVSGGGRESTAIRAFRMGVSDFLPKAGLRPEHLVASVLKGVERRRKETLAGAEYKRLVEAAGIDPATGLEGPSRIDERLKQIAALSAQSRPAYALVLVELIEYQQIADRFGIKTADQCLRLFAKRLQTLSRSGDLCGRYSEATFLIIAELGSEGAALDAICRRLAGNLSLRVSLDRADLALSARVAGSRCGGASLADPSELLQPVKLALAEAKASSLPFVALPEGSVAHFPIRARRDPPTLPDLPPSAFELDDPSVADSRRAEDRRRAPRHRVFKRGILHMPDGYATTNCTVRNLSSLGAGLRLEAVFAVPETFDLQILGSGERRRAQVRWQSSADVGVEFVRTTELDRRGQSAVVSVDLDPLSPLADSAKLEPH